MQCFWYAHLMGICHLIPELTWLLNAINYIKIAANLEYIKILLGIQYG